jgi:hypothetical protein
LRTIVGSYLDVAKFVLYVEQRNVGNKVQLIVFIHKGKKRAN